MGDTPEQCLLTGVVGGFCPVCTVPKDRLGEQSRRWPLRVPKTRPKRARGELGEQLQVTVPFTERLWPVFTSHLPVGPDVPHQLNIGLLKHYLIVWVIELLQHPSYQQPLHIRGRPVDALDRRIAALHPFHGLRRTPESRFSQLSQWTGKEYLEICRIFIVAIAPLLLHHLQYLKAVRHGIDFMLLANYQFHPDSTLRYLKKALALFDKEKTPLHLKG